MSESLLPEDDLRKKGDGLLPHEIIEGNIRNAVNSMIKVFEKTLTSEVGKTAVDVDYDYIIQQVRTVLAGQKERVITEMTLITTVMTLMMIDGNPLFGAYRDSLIKLTNMIVEKYKPSDITSDALGLVIGDTIKKADEADEADKRQLEVNEAEPKKPVFFNPKEGNC